MSSSLLERSLLSFLGSTESKVELEVNILSNISSIEMSKEQVKKARTGRQRQGKFEELKFHGDISKKE